MDRSLLRSANSLSDPAHLARRRPACPKCRKDAPDYRYRFEHLRMIQWGRPRLVVKIVNWCGHAQDFVPWPQADGYWLLVSLWGDAA